MGYMEPTIKEVMERDERVRPDFVYKEKPIKMLQCPECESTDYVNQGGCYTCFACGYSKCG